MLLQLNRTFSRPLYLQLADQLRGLIQSGTLPDGHRLPPERRREPFPQEPDAVSVRNSSRWHSRHLLEQAGWNV